MDTEVSILSGYLTIKSHSGFSINRISKNKIKYCQLFKSSRHGIERLEISDSENDKNPRIITLENCVKITQEAPPNNIINIITKTGQLQLNTPSEILLKQWTTALQSVAFKEKTSQVGTLNRNTVIEEDNDLYCSSYNEGIFTVTLIASEASLKCHLESKMYTLMLTTSEIQLKSYDDESMFVAKWPYRYIRKYGYRDGKFTFEAGRKCDTGEGVFKLDNVNPQEIFRCMSAKMKSMKKLINGDSICNANNLNCGENQLNAALSMEPGSRSPLPPSTQSHSSTPNTSFIDMDSSHQSLRGFLSSTDSLNVSTSSTQSPLIIKNNIPNKPPRKSINPINLIISTNENLRKHPAIETKVKNIKATSPTTNVSSIFIQNSTSIDKSPELPTRNNTKLQIPNKKNDRDYECIENITDAWKTLGVGEIKHTENVATPEDELMEFVWQRTKSQREISNNNNNNNNNYNNNNHNNNNNNNEESSDKNYNDDKIISVDDGNYDKLEFFRSNSKVSSGYKTIVPIKLPNQPPIKKPAISDDYEFVGSPVFMTTVNNNIEDLPDTLPFRKADDSYLGYGVIRKPCIAGPQVGVSSQVVLTEDDEALDHSKYNGLDYAIVSKPKRV